MRIIIQFNKQESKEWHRDEDDLQHVLLRSRIITLLDQVEHFYNIGGGGDVDFIDAIDVVDDDGNYLFTPAGEPK